MDRHFNAEETIREFQISPLSCGVRRLFICVIKLKDIIKELNEGVEPLKISKMEEAEAVNYIKIKVIPEIVKIFNETHPSNFIIGKDGRYIKRDTGLRIKPSDISQSLKKTKQSWGYQYDRNIEVITYSSDIQLTQRKKGHQQHHVFDFYIYKDRQSRKIKIEVNLRLSYHGNKIFIMGASLTESVSPQHLKVSKKEEAEAVAFIKRKSIPYAVETWNNYWRVDPPHPWSLTVDSIRKVLKKIGITEDGDIVIYKTQFHVKGTSPHEFVFRIFKSDWTDRLSVQIKLNLQRAGDCTWKI